MEKRKKEKRNEIKWHGNWDGTILIFICSIATKQEKGELTSEKPSIQLLEKIVAISNLVGEKRRIVLQVSMNIERHLLANLTQAIVNEGKKGRRVKQHSMNKEYIVQMWKKWIAHNVWRKYDNEVFPKASRSFFAQHFHSLEHLPFRYHTSASLAI